LQIAAYAQGFLNKGFFMKEIFLGFVFDEKKCEQIYKDSKTGLQIAGNQYQMGFLEGLNRKLDIISVLPVGTFPKGNKRINYKYDFAMTKQGKIEYISFTNLYFIKDLTQMNSLIRALKQRIDKYEFVTIYVYSLYMPFLSSLQKLKKKYTNLSICLIVPDLPGKYGILRPTFSLGGMRDRIEARKKIKLAQIADSYVLLTETMTEVLPKRPYTVIEGFLPQQKFDYSNKREAKTVLYTGSLNAAYGIDKLLDAFAQIADPDFRLWICGAGGIQSTVEEYAKKDNRITYFGFLPKDKVAELQTRCDILINPRSPHGEYTKYSFPSKTMEYLLSGSKVLMYRLPGVPEEYYDYIYTIDGSTSEDIAAAIIKACEDKSFQARRTEQIEWIKTQKNNQTQMKKLTELLNEV